MASLKEFEILLGMVKVARMVKRKVTGMGCLLGMVKVARMVKGKVTGMGCLIVSWTETWKVWLMVGLTACLVSAAAV